jgi:SP family facilitated glucose transporter-like MFS transporter 3
VIDATVVTIPLVFAIVVAAPSQFLVGYNTGVINALEKVVFAGYSTLSWSLAVAAFAVGGPFGLWCDYRRQACRLQRTPSS